MRTIFKYRAMLGRFGLEMPVGAEVLTIQVQGGDFVLWARVDDSKPKTARRFALVGTGHGLGEAAQWDYRGTVQDGPLVFHLLAEPS